MSSLPAIYESFPEPKVVENRRQSARSPIFTLVKARGSREPMWAWDIGMGGMQCRTQQPRFPGSFVDLQFALPGSNDVLDVGGQVLSLEQLDAHLSVGLRFCMLSSRDQRLLYRFLDQRRALWSGETDAPSSAQTRVARWVAEQNRPFEAMLLEAYASIRAKELQRLASVRSVSRCDLPRLSSLTARA
ncbi:MAG: hypothetical protein A2289_15750 [Deltaproteobacteria bacterium RIFOXYA12_FULL_58_15]|nr:MAG: hypothetical protein A2289_15750 [Deltaproteobacteria bacterium RIFOXYA12_FULL_58_15]OGR10373.1 MAG: hypothetical protein A2341_22925 [Deltaproteobacteria bacterium RIFOXYB12_FULL_58_9]